MKPPCVLFILVVLNFHYSIADLNGQNVSLTPSRKHVSYYFYSRQSQDSPFIITNSQASELSNAHHFKPWKKTIFLIHGWVDNCTGNLNTFVKPAIFNKLDVNLIAVDWSPIAAQHYIAAQSSVKAIGTFVGDFIKDYMKTFEISNKEITLIGHSLGAHVSGNAGKVTKGKLAHIIALDPAGPGFDESNTENRLNSNDARYVQAIHTNMAFWGFSKSLGHVDYYPNGGYHQNGCGIDFFGSCSHTRVINYLAEGINGGRFIARKCESYLKYVLGVCKWNEHSRMGLLEVDHRIKGDFYLSTNEESPFAQG